VPVKDMCGAIKPSFMRHMAPQGGEGGLIVDIWQDLNTVMRHGWQGHNKVVYNEDEYDMRNVDQNYRLYLKFVDNDRKQRNRWCTAAIRIL
jgi:hypothetical protein